MWSQLKGTKRISDKRQYWLTFRKFFPKRNHVLIACFPKSGSTYLRTIIANLPNMVPVTLTTGYDRREQELSIEQLIFNHKKNYVASHHTRYSLITQKLMDDFEICPIVLVRNIYDVIISLHDHFFREGTSLPMGNIQNEIKEWEKVNYSKYNCGT